MSRHWGRPGFWHREGEVARRWGMHLAELMLNYVLLLAAFLVLSWLFWPFLATLSSGARAFAFAVPFWLVFIAMTRGWLPRVRIRRPRR
jgi:hypothetical protein